MDGGEASVRRQLGPPGPQRLERPPETRLRSLLVERIVDVRDDERLDRRRQLLQSARARLERLRERELETVQQGERLVAHDDDKLRLHYVKLPEEEALALLDGLALVLE